MSGVQRILTFEVGFNFIRYLQMTNGVMGVPSSIATPSASYDDFLQAMVKIVRQQTEPIDGIAFSVPGFVNVDRQFATASGRLASISHHRLGDDINAALGTSIPTWMENDANCVAIAEKNRGNARKYDDFVVITITDTGMGGAIVIDGKLHRGRAWRAGEFGMIASNYETGGWKTLHEYTGMTSLATRYAERFHVPADSVVPSSLLRRIDEPEIRLLVEDWAEYIAIAIFNVIAVIDPQCVLIGGLISQETDCIALIRQALERHPSWKDFRTPITRCRYANVSAFYGAYDAFMAERAAHPVDDSDALAA